MRHGVGGAIVAALIISVVIAVALVFSASIIAGGLAKTSTTTQVSTTTETSTVTEVSTSTEVSTAVTIVTVTPTNLTLQGSSLVEVTGTLTVPSGSGAATLVVNVKNSANGPITSITISSDAANQANSVVSITSSNGSEFPDGSPAIMYSGSLPVGQSTSAVFSINSPPNTAIAGDTYTFTVTTSFSGGTSTQVLTLSLTAQL